jgi:hypothetical protein
MQTFQFMFLGVGVARPIFISGRRKAKEIESVCFFI